MTDTQVITTEPATAAAEPDVPDRSTTHSVEPALDRRLGSAFWLAVGWLGVLVAAAAIAPLLPIPDPLDASPADAKAGPSWSHLLGADTLGRDLLSRILYGARASLLIAAVATVTAGVVGTALGTVAGYVRSISDTVIMTAMDMMLAFPILILALALTAFRGPSIANVILALTVAGTPIFARLARSQALTYGRSDFVLASRVIGSNHRQILTADILPNVVPTVAGFAVVFAAIAIVVEGSLSFLGVGVPLPTPTWGSIIAEGQRELRTAPHIGLISAVLMFFTVFALNHVGSALQQLAADRSGR